MMDGNLGDHNCFSKLLLDWLVPSVYSSRTSGIQLHAAANDLEAVILMPRRIPFTLYSDYFMVQNRVRSGKDSGRDTDITVINPGSTLATGSLKLQRSDGTTRQTISISIPPHDAGEKDLHPVDRDLLRGGRLVGAPYSVRNATMGSTRVALRAGTAQARSATIESTKTTAVIVKGSRELTWNSRLCRS